MQVVLEEITFNHDIDFATCDAFNIRKNETEFVTRPEWKRKTSTLPEHSVAAYAIKELDKNVITIKARFTRDDLTVTSVEIQGINISPDDPPLRSREDEQAIASTVLPQQPCRNNVLGWVPPQSIDFLEGGDTLKLCDSKIAQTGVGVHVIHWLWQFRLHNQDSWKNIDKTCHQIYTVIGLPQEPWRQGPNEAGNTQLPWIDVLDQACRWAAGATDLNPAALKITTSINLLGPAFVQYDVKGHGGPHFTPNNPTRFDCQKFLNLLKAPSSVPDHFVNCDDCAAMVCTFANVLGCRFPQSNIGSKLHPRFTLRPHQKIGLGSWEVNKHFNYHAVAWSGIEQDGVSDACLKLDDNDRDLGEQPKPVFVSNLPFAGSKSYRHLLVLGNEKDCVLKESFFRSIGLKYKPVPQNILDAKLLALSLVESFKQLSAINEFYPTDIRFVPDDMVEGYWTINDDPGHRILRLDAQVSTTDKGAEANLEDQLKRFELPGITPRESAGFGEKVFANDPGSTILFSRNKLTVLLRNVGSEEEPLWTVARFIDAFILSLSPTNENQVDSKGGSQEMAHELDGYWHLFIINEQSGKPNVAPDGTFYLKHNAANELESTSVHIDKAGTSFKLTGSSKPSGSGGFDIEILEEQPDSKPRPYYGRVMENKPATDPKRKVIGGITLEPESLAADRSKKLKALEPGQIDGIWVGTHP